MHQFFTADDGARIAFTDTGTGKPLLCLAGLTRNSSDFQYLLPHLPDRRVICMDYRGRGASDWTGAETYSVERESQDVLQLLINLNLASAPILGTSRGGLIGLGLAALAPDVVEGLCLNDVGPVLDIGGLDRIKDYVGRNPSAKSMQEAADMLRVAAAEFNNVPTARWLSEAQTHFRDEGPKLTINYDPALREAFLAAFTTPLPDAWPLFDMIGDIPLGLIRGANSNLCSAQTAREMQNRRPDLIWADVSDRGHVPFLDEPESLDVITRFLKACDAN